MRIEIDGHDVTQYWTCATCRGFPSGPRQGEHHVAVRFGDGKRFRVYLDGEDVTNDATEACAGREGWVVMYQGMPAYRLLCGDDHAATMVRSGHVSIESTNTNTPD